MKAKRPHYSGKELLHRRAIERQQKQEAPIIKRLKQCNLIRQKIKEKKKEQDYENTINY